MTDNSNQFQERNEQALNDIRQLQQYEQELYSSLENPNLTTEEKQHIVTRINELSQMRMNLYTSLKNMYGNYQKNASVSESTLDQQMTAIEILEEELGRTRLRLNALDAEKQNKLRVVEINDYYGKRYQAHKKIAITVFILCIPIIILAVLANSGVLPPKLYATLVVIIIVCGFVYIGYQLIDMSNRSNMNWDEYTWRFDKENAPVDTTDASSKKNPWATTTVVCIGAECCQNGDTYDEKLNKCISSSSSSASSSSSSSSSNTEAFTNAVLTKYAMPTSETFYSGTRTNKVSSHNPGVFKGGNSHLYV